jgi:Phage tail protein (Tail_P2_I)
MPIILDPPESTPLPPLADDGSSLWELLYESHGYHRDLDEATGYTLRKFCEAWCSPVQGIYDIVRERSDAPSWSILLDPDRCPAKALPYLAQYVGVAITPEMSEQQIRNEIREPTGWARGRPPAIRIATRRTLKPLGDEELMVIIRPRTPEVGHHYVRTLLSQTPDPERTEYVVRNAVPAWELLDYDAINGVTFSDITAKFESFGDLTAAFPTFKDLAEVLPTEL